MILRKVNPQRERAGARERRCCILLKLVRGESFWSELATGLDNTQEREKKGGKKGIVPIFFSRSREKFVPEWLLARWLFVRDRPDLKVLFPPHDANPTYFVGDQKVSRPTALFLITIFRCSPDRLGETKNNLPRWRSIFPEELSNGVARRQRKSPESAQKRSAVPAFVRTSKRQAEKRASVNSEENKSQSGF